MQLYEIEFDHFGESGLLNEEAIEILKEASVTSLEFRDDTTRDGKRLEYATPLPVVSADALQRLTLAGVKPVVKRVLDNSTTKSLVDFGQRTTTYLNQKCSVAVSGIGLLSVEQVKIEADLCTDRLQELLDDGWRIVAVCVQPDQRRPDYILGRSK